jgi:hypothetical protein
MPNNPNAAKNLMAPVQKGGPARPGAGRPVGSITFSVLIKSLLQDKKLADKVITKKPEWWNALPNKRFAEAIVVAMMVQAAKGDVRAAEWLAHRGFGDEFIEEPVEPRALIYINELPPREVRERKVIDGQIIKDTPDIQT